MDTWVWVAIIAAVVIVLLLVVWGAFRKRRTTALRDRFGPEYDRTVDRSGSRRRAEVDLRDRAKERERLDIRPLSPSACRRYEEEWRSVQLRFVDHPESAVAEADALVGHVMRERGYPVEDFEERADLVSVDHPHVVENYRKAHGIHRRHLDGHASTEDLREALVHYRSLFDELLVSSDEVPSTDGGGRTAERRYSS